MTTEETAKELERIRELAAKEERQRQAALAEAQRQQEEQIMRRMQAASRGY